MALQTFRTSDGSRVKHKISVAGDFSTHPGPRYIKQGNWSGEKFRKLLEARLDRHEFIEVDLDGTRGYGSSFLDEAFGGLIRSTKLTKSEFNRRISIKSEEDPTYRDEALEAVQQAVVHS